MPLITDMPVGHNIMVTGGGPFGRAWFDCACGIKRVYGSKNAANVSALAHFADIGGVVPVELKVAS